METKTKTGNVLAKGNLGVVLATALMGVLGFGDIKEAVRETASDVREMAVAMADQSRKMDSLAEQLRATQVQVAVLPSVQAELQDLARRVAALEIGARGG